MSIRVTVNDETLSLPPASSIADLLEHLDLTGRRIAVEHNGGIVPRSRYDQTALADEDVILVVQAIGGG